MCGVFFQSLSGHTTPVECVRFNSHEELVAAGSQSGSLKIWDLEAAKSKSQAFCHVCMYVTTGLPSEEPIRAVIDSTLKPVIPDKSALLSL